MKRYLINLILFVFILAGIAFGQAAQRPNGGTITGRIFESSLEKPIEYANIILFTQNDSTQSGGTISSADGSFELGKLRPGKYYLEIRFMGYKMKRVDNILIKPPLMLIDIGIIPLEPTILNLEGVEIEGEKPAFTYEIDKKVINVDRMQTAASGTAVEVLENVPSVTVDIEGNVSLRGSSNFMLLIDGRPTILDANDALKQLPASTIEDIEIITNPSAKYEPDGTSGIINIKLKKNSYSGVMGLLNINGGINDKYGMNLLLENKLEKSKWTAGIFYFRNDFYGENKNENQTTLNDITSFIYSNGDSRRGRNFGGIRLGYDYDLTSNDLFSISARIGKGAFNRYSDYNYNEWTSEIDTHNEYLSDHDHERAMNFYMGAISYIHKFPQKGHELNASLDIGRRTGDETSTSELMNLNGNMISGRETTEDGPGQRIRFKLDYTLPINKASKIEAGLQSEIRHSTDETGLSDYDLELDKYIEFPEYSHETNYRRNTEAVYTTYSNTLGKFGFQAGLRGEYTYRTIELTDENQKFTIDRWDYFPTTHFSYQFTDARQMMASYTRRINRPRGYYLEPFETWRDAYNVNIGNPALKPEYIDSYETGYQTYFGKNLISTEVYYRITNNKIERIKSAYAENVTLHSVNNVGKDYSLGTELLINFDLFKIWGVNLIGNLYDYRIEGTLYDEPFSRSSFNWSGRFNNSVKLTKSTQFQINGRYNSKTVTSQGESEGYLSMDLALRQEFFEKQLTATLQIRDVFGTARHEFTSSGPDFYSYDYYDGESPVVQLNLRYNINHYKPNRRDRSGQGNDDMTGDDF